MEKKKTITKQNKTNYYFYGKFNKVENSKYSLSSLKISSSAHHALQYLEISVICQFAPASFSPPHQQGRRISSAGRKRVRDLGAN